MKTIEKKEELNERKIKKGKKTKSRKRIEKEKENGFKEERIIKEEKGWWKIDKNLEETE